MNLQVFHYRERSWTQWTVYSLPPTKLDHSCRLLPHLLDHFQLYQISAESPDSAPLHPSRRSFPSILNPAMHSVISSPPCLRVRIPKQEDALPAASTKNWSLDLRVLRQCEIAASEPVGRWRNDDSLTFRGWSSEERSSTRVGLVLKIFETRRRKPIYKNVTGKTAFVTDPTLGPEND